MTIKEFMDGIQLPKDAQAAAVQIPLPKEEFVRMNRLFWQDIPAFWEETEKKQNAPQWFLRFYTTMGPECFSRFREAGISQDIFFATLKDITGTPSERRDGSNWRRPRRRTSMRIPFAAHRAWEMP